MAYVPVQIAVYDAALAGALGGMGASPMANQVSPTTSGNYATLVDVALAFAQQFDTEWNTSPADTLTVETIESVCVSAMQSRTPRVTAQTLTPTSWKPTVDALIAIIKEEQALIAGMNIFPPPIQPQSGITANRPTNGLQIGQIYFDTTLDEPVWWDGASWVLAVVVPPPPPAPPIPCIIFRPGVASSGFVVRTPTEVETLLAAAVQPLVIYVDTTFGAATWDTNHVVPGKGNTWLSALHPTEAGGAVTLTIADGTTLKDFAGIEGYLTVACACVTTPALDFSYLASQAFFRIVGLDANLSVLGGAGVPVHTVPATPGFVFNLQTSEQSGVQDANAGVAMFGVGVGGRLIWIARTGFTNSVTALVSGAAGSFFDFHHDDSVAAVPASMLGLFGGTAAPDLRESLADRVAPAVGGHAGRPTATAFQGQMYFDISLAGGNGQPVWWNGAAWVLATGVISP